MKTLVAIKLRENHRTINWLLGELIYRGYKISRTELSKAISGARQTPKSERILDASLDVIKDYEKEELERLLKLQEK